MKTLGRFNRRTGALIACCVLALAAAGTARADTTAPDGAVGLNIGWEQGTQKYWYIELQRDGAQDIENGINSRNAQQIQLGIKVLNWGFARQAGDGSFPGTGNGVPGEAFHSASLFIEAAARSVLDLHAYDPKTYGSWIKATIPHLQTGALWLMTPAVAATGQQYNAPFTHRRYLLAATLLEVGAVTGNTNVANASVPYINDGLSRQLPRGWSAAITRNADGTYPPAKLLSPGQRAPAGTVSILNAQGVNPEDNGYDVNYQCVGIVYAEYYVRIYPNAAIRQQLLSMIANGLAFETQLIDKYGNVTAIGSTRIGQERDLAGNIKPLSTSEIRKAFELAYTLTGNPSYQAYAKLIK